MSRMLSALEKGMMRASEKFPVNGCFVEQSEFPRVKANLHELLDKVAKRANGWATVHPSVDVVESMGIYIEKIKEAEIQLPEWSCVESVDPGVELPEGGLDLLLCGWVYNNASVSDTRLLPNASPGWGCGG